MKRQTPLPERTRRGLRAGAVGLITVAAVGNIGHTYEHAHRLGQDPWAAAVIAALPDVTLILSILRLRHDRRSAWAWTGVSASAGFVAWALISTAHHGLGGQIVALSTLAAAVIATGLLEGGGEETLEQFVERTSQAVAAAEDAARQAHELAGRQAAGAAHEARLAAARAQAAELELAGARAALEAAREAAHEAARAVVPPPRTGKSAKRTAGARKVPARAGGDGSDLQRRAHAREAFTESVRAGAPLTNDALAALIYGVQTPDPRQVRAASARASEWRRAVGDGQRTDVAEQAAGGESLG